MKPIFRWTIGSNILPNGYILLKHSIREALRVYGKDKFQWYVCHNVEPENYLKLLSITENTPVQLYKQTWKEMPFPEEKPKKHKEEDLKKNKEISGSIWKICPPRLSLNVHEIVLDNDVIIVKKIEEIESFLNSKKTLVGEDCSRFYEKYDKFIDQNKTYNSGIYGLPPNYDFSKELYNTWNNCGKITNHNYGDEQGLVICTLTKHDFLSIKTQNLPVLHKDKYNKKNFEDTNDSVEWCEYNDKFWKNTYPKCKGFHFVGSNRFKNHIAWRKWIELKNSIL